MYKGTYSNRYDFYANGFLALVSMALSLYAIHLVGETAMTQPVPPQVLLLFIFAGFFALLALYNGVRMMFAPKDNRFDNINEKLDKLLNLHVMPQMIDLGNINKQIREDLQNTVR